MEIIMADKLDSMIQTLKHKDSEAGKIEDPLLSRFLKYVHVLEKLEAKAINENNLLLMNELFYSRYYWFNQFKERYFALYGHDEGLEQQSFKILSDFNERFPNKTDWNIIEKIDNNSI